MIYPTKNSVQGKAYQDTILNQFGEYHRLGELQGQAYADTRTYQGDEYAALHQRQGDDCKQAMTTCADQRSACEEARQKAISLTASVLETLCDNYGRAFKGTVSSAGPTWEPSWPACWRCG